MREKRRGFPQNTPIKGGSLLRREEGLRRLEIAHLRLKGGSISLWDIRGIANDEIKPIRSRLKRREEISPHEIKLRKAAVALRIYACRLKGPFIDVGGNNVRVGKFFCQRNRQRPAPGAKIENTTGSRRDRARPLDDQLGLGPRNKNPGADRNGEPAEIDLTGNVLDRLAPGAPR